jgi:FlaG protein
MGRALDPVSSSGHSIGYANIFPSRPRDKLAGGENPKQGCGDLIAAISIYSQRICNILQALHSCVEEAKRDLKFQIHEDTDQVLVEVIAKEDGRVIREIPSEALLDLEARFDEMTGVLFSKEV